MTETRIGALASRATVRLGPADEPATLWGSGFFVAPGWLLSCAHILPDGVPLDKVGPILVHGAHGRATARLGYWLGDGADPEQDLLLVRLLEDIPHHCVRLSDRYDKPHRVTAYGWHVPAKAAPPDTWSGDCLVNGTYGTYGLTLGPQAEIPHGASGGPLLDVDRGVVAGVVKARRRCKDGGLAIATTALRGFTRAVPVGGEDALGPDPYRALIRAHDRWHHRMREQRGSSGASWVARQEGLHSEAGASWTARDGAAASALLAELPPPASPSALKSLIEQVLGAEPLWPGEALLRDWRDGHGWLYESADGDAVAFLHYLLLVARACSEQCPSPARKLKRWVRGRSEQLPGPHQALLKRAKAPVPAALVRAAATDTNGPVVTVELEPDAFRPDDRFHWRIWTWAGGARPAGAWAQETGQDGVALAELPHLLSEPLRAAFIELDTEQRPARLELALPVAKFDVDVHLWRAGLVARTIRPDPAERPFGVHRQVVLRSLDRRGAPPEAWQARWRGVADGGLRALPLADAVGESGWLDAARDGDVPVLCRTAAEGAGPLGEAIDAGFGLALWSRGTPHRAGCGAGCALLHGGVAELLRRAGRACALPEELRLLRERISCADTRADWAEPLALLYDDPDRPLPEFTQVLNSPE
ncbi:hypothetical protein ABCR94_10020 [Streptomyces sp. 21So2-11]|uniref:VMAP-C domain-containing protein n=1 Tax=Streptomyces sp. 21So2-11 TaxID=3144408 RepID=UPI00321B3E7F